MKGQSKKWKPLTNGQTIVNHKSTNSPKGGHISFKDKSSSDNGAR